jgi:hypothetical protein
MPDWLQPFALGWIASDIWRTYVLPRIHQRLDKRKA